MAENSSYGPPRRMVHHQPWEPNQYSPQVSLKEEQYMVTAGILGAFMQGGKEETAHMQHEGILADLLVKCNPFLYCSYISEENGHKVLYVSRPFMGHYEHPYILVDTIQEAG